MFSFSQVSSIGALNPKQILTASLWSLSRPSACPLVSIACYTTEQYSITDRMKQQYSLKRHFPLIPALLRWYIIQILALNFFLISDMCRLTSGEGPKLKPTSFSLLTGLMGSPSGKYDPETYPGIPPEPKKPTINRSSYFCFLLCALTNSGVTEKEYSVSFLY